MKPTNPWAQAPTPEALAEAEKRLQSQGFTRTQLKPEENAMPWGEQKRERQYKENNKISGENQVEVLQAFAAHFASPPKWKIGDIITPRKDCTLRGAGKPHIVLELNIGGAPVFSGGDEGSTGWGARPEVRVGVCIDGTVALYWCELHQFEEWKPEAKLEAVADDSGKAKS